MTGRTSGVQKVLCKQFPSKAAFILTRVRVQVPVRVIVNTSLHVF